MIAASPTTVSLQKYTQKRYFLVAIIITQDSEASRHCRQPCISRL